MSNETYISGRTQPNPPDYIYDSYSETMVLTSKMDKDSEQIHTKKQQIFILIGCFINHVLLLGLNHSLGVIYVDLIRDFDALRSEAALVQSVNLGTMLGSGILFTNAVERFGPGLCSLVGMSAAAVSLFISVFSTSIFMVIAFVGFTAGIGLGVTFLANFMAINETFKTRKRTAMAILTIATPVAQFSFPYITEFLLEKYYWNGTFLILSGFLLNNIPFSLLNYFNYSSNASAERKVIYYHSKSFSSIFKQPAVVFVLVLMTLVDMGIIPQLLFTVDLAELRGYDRREGAVLYSYIGLTSFVGRLIATLLLNFLVNVSATFHYTHGLAVYGVAYLIVIFFKDYGRMTVGIVLQGYSSGLLVANFPGLMIEQCGADIFPKVLALSNVIDGVISIAGGFLGGFLADKTGGYDILYYLAAGCTEFGAVMTVTRLIIDKIKPGQPNTETMADNSEKDLLIG